MAMDLTEDFETMFDTDEFGVSATYTPPSGSAVSTEILISQSVREVNGELAAIANEYVVTIQSADISRPARNATIVIASGDYAGTYLVDSIVGQDDAATFRVAVTKQ